MGYGTLPGPSSGTSAFGAANFDSFTRLRTSDTGQRLDVEFLYNKQPEFFDEILVGGSSSVTWNSNTRDLTLATGTVTDGHSATMSSHPVPYTPGNSQLVEMTGVLNLANIAGGTTEYFLRSNISGTPLDLNSETQVDWDAQNTGVDWSYSHIFAIDFQSLKVGRIRFMMNVGGVASIVGEITNDNLRNSGYWQLANLPITYRIYNTATETITEIAYGDTQNAVGFRHRIPVNASASMKAICCTVKSEGGKPLSDVDGVSRAVDLEETTRTVSSTLIPILSIRPKATYQGVPNLILAIPQSIRVQTTESIRYVVLHNTTLTAPVWNDVSTADSMMEYDIAASDLANGHVLDSGYIFASTAGGKGSVQVGASLAGGLLDKSVLWNRLGTTTGILTVAAVITDVTDSEVFAAMRWLEIR